MNTETRIIESQPSEGGLCLACRSSEGGCPKYQELADRLSSAVRLCKFALVACFFFCTLLVLMFSCSVYLFMEIMTVRQEISRCKLAVAPADYSLTDSSVTTLYLQTDELYGDMDSQGNDNIGGRQFRSNGKPREKENKRRKPKQRGNKKKKYNCCKCCKKIRNIERSIRSLQQTLTQLTTLQPPTTSVPADRHKLSYIAAAHYSTYMTEAFINERFGELDPGRLEQAVRCKMIAEWHGEACRNRTYSPHHDGSPLTLNVFEEAGWMKNISQEPLFNKTNTGVFIARHTGIYLLYAHVLFYDAKTKQAVAIVHESAGVSKNVLRCMESVDYVDPSQDIGTNSRYKSCSVTGVVYMTVGDNVAVKNLYSHTRMDLTSDATYFGGLLFAVRDIR